MDASDFLRYFLPAVKAWLEGDSPYAIPGVYNPPWAWWMLTPLASYAPTTAFGGWAVLSVAALLVAVTLIRRPAPWELLLLVLAPVTLVHLAMGQWTIWLLLGVALLQQRRSDIQGAGLLLLALKPHLGWPFLLASRPRAWPIPLGAIVLSLLVQPRWMLDFLASLRAEPPIGYANLILLRSLMLGPPFLVALGVGVLSVTLWAAWRYRAERRWLLAMLCCVAPLLTPYHRLYDNILLFYPILLLTKQRSAWILVLPLLWLSALLVSASWAVFVDWIPCIVLLAVLVRRLPTDRGAQFSAAAMQ